MQSLKVLLVDDDDVVRVIVQNILCSLGYETLDAKNAADAIESASNNSIDIALLDYRLPDKNGIELMQQLKEISPTTISIVITGDGSIERAVKAMQAGAWDFLTKPITLEMLREKIGRIEEYCLLRREYDYHHKVAERNFVFSGVIGPSAAMQSVYEGILRAAQSNLPVLIEGETGAGKEYVAEAIHLNSRRKDQPFVVMDCTATPQSLIESVLFGCTKGAFTGAIERRGLLKEADKGTLFLDEIGEITLEIQPKLLRCLETKRFRPLGSSKEIMSDFRIICATNRDLKTMTQKEAFRSDLFYRISAHKIYIPPLRERPSDIPILVRYFLKQIAHEHDREEIEMTPEALRILTTHDWQGNIRQLKFVIETAFFNTTEPRINPEHIFLEGLPSVERTDQLVGMQPDTNMDLKTYREEVILLAERAYLNAVLEETQGDVRQAAKHAGLTREAFYRVIMRCGISASQYRDKAS
jgi:DNA-binding NtrC family response regulator